MRRRGHNTPVERQECKGGWSAYSKDLAVLLQRVGKKARQRKHNIRLLQEKISIQYFLKVWVAWLHKVLERAHMARTLARNA
jgi:hypothetical protein